jgi:hypothetical protein
MTIAGAIALIAIGAILRYAVNVNTEGFDVNEAGLILMIAGAVGLAITLLFDLVRRDREPGEPVETVVERERRLR